MQQISVPSPPVCLGEPLFDLQVMPDHANSFSWRPVVLRFVAICDRCAHEFGPSPCVSRADSIDLRNHHIWFTLPQWNYKSRLVICTQARLIELNKPPSFFCPPEHIDGKERLVPEIYKSLTLKVYSMKWKMKDRKTQQTKQSQIYLLCSAGIRETLQDFSQSRVLSWVYIVNCATLFFYPKISVLFIFQSLLN